MQVFHRKVYSNQMDKKEMEEIKVLIADDHTLFAEGMQLLLKKKSCPLNVNIIGICSNGEEVIDTLSQQEVDLLILDLKMPKLDGFNVIPVIRKQLKLKTLRILVVTQYNEDKFIRLAFKNGADGYILKAENSQEFFHAIQTVLRNEVYLGKGLRTSPPKKNLSENVAPSTLSREETMYDLSSYLTKREIQVLEHVSKGLNNREIAERLYISQDTVNVHRRNILKKLRVKNTAGLIKFALEHNIV